VSDLSRGPWTRPSRWATRLVGMAGVAVLALLVPRASSAQDLTAAANAYSRAQQAELAGRPAAAAELYEIADSAAPSPEALRSALRTRRAAGQLATAALHAETLLERYPDDKRSTDLARETLEAAKNDLARYEIACAPESCGLIVDGVAAGPTVRKLHIVYLEPGEHEISASFGSGTAKPAVVSVEAGGTGSLSFEAPPESGGEVSDASSATPTRGGSLGSTEMDPGTTAGGGGLSPWYFAAGVVVTAGFGAAAVWSGLDVLNAHEDYQRNQTQSGYEDGRDRERRTNILIGAAAGAAAATAVLAFFTNWGGSEEPSQTGRTGSNITASVNPSLTGATVTIRGTY
jgi:hypothetical protein